MVLPIRDLLRRREQRRLVAEAKREPQRGLPREQHVRVLLEQVARKPDRVLELGHLRHGAGAPVGSHQRRVDARHAVRLKVRAGSGVQRRLVLEPPHRRLDGVQRAAALRQRGPAGVGGALGRGAALGFLVGGRHAAAAVHDQRGFHARAKRARILTARD
jgi:hypothetical protein